MSTKNQTTSQNNLQYQPGSMSNYNALTGAGTNVLTQYMNSPLNNGFFNLGQGMGQAAAQKQGQTSMQSLLQNMKTSGISGNAGNAFQLAQQGKIGRSTASAGAQSTMGNVLSAFQRQMQATGMGMSFNPLLTGQSGTSTQTQSGLGTWLPQLIGTLGGAAIGGLTGGVSPQSQAKATNIGGAGSLPGGGFGAGIGMGAGSTFGSSMGQSSINPFSLIQSLPSLN